MFIYSVIKKKRGKGMSEKHNSVRGRPQAERVREHRVSMRLFDDDFDKLEYWSNKLGISKTELLIRSLNHYIGWVNADYDLPTAEQARLNQIVDSINTLISNQKNMETTIVQGLDSMIGFVRGGNYLTDDDDEGEDL